MTLWTYWEQSSKRARPAYLDLCLRTLRKNAGPHEVRVLDENTVREWLPDLREDLDAKLILPLKTDVIRFHLIREYGGMWLDFDTILMKKPNPIEAKLKEVDFIAFGARPNVWVIAGVKGSETANAVIEVQDELLDKHGKRYLTRQYFATGRNALRSVAGKTPFHLWDGGCVERDSRNRKIGNRRLVSREPLDEDCKKARIFLPIYHTAPGFPQRVKSMSEKEILESGTLMGNTFRQALGMKKLKQKSRGLGDTVAKITEAVGIKPCGGCKGRREKLNRLISYGKRGRNKS